MARVLMFASLLIASLTGIIYYSCAITWFLFSFMVVLCFWQRKIDLLFKILLLTLPFMVYFIYNSHCLQQQISQKNDKQHHVAGIIFPDDIQIDGANFKATAQLDNHEKVKLYWIFPDEKIKNMWLENNKVISFQAETEFTRIPEPTNFNQFNSQKFYLTKSITHQINIKSWHTKGAKPSTLLQKIRYQLHEWHSMGIHNAERLPSPLSAYAEALILGTTPQSLYEDNPGVQTLGLIDLFSVSGFHVTFLMTMLMQISRRIWLPKEYTILVLSIILIAYFIFAGEPDVLIRSIVSGELILLKDITNKRIKAQVIWALSLLFSLAIVPQILLTLGGQLSFALTFCLTFAQRLTFWQTNLLMSLVSFPLIIQQQYTWHVLQTLINFAAIPIFGTVIVPLVMVGFFGQFIPLLTYITNLVIRYFAYMVDFCATLPGNFVVGKIPDALAVVLLFLALGVFAREPKIKHVARISWLVSFGVAMICVHLPYHGEFATFDIGQGDAAVIREPYNKTITLIDTGGKVTFGEQPAWQKQKYVRTNGETVIVNYLHSRGISKIDNLVLSHHDQDHIGNAKVILTKMNVKNVIIPAGMMQQSSFKTEIKPYLKSAKVTEVTNNIQVSKLPLQIIHPFKSGQAKNEDCIALFGNIGGKNIFTAGDLDQSGEKKIANFFPDMHVDILKFGHHGSKTSTNPEVINKWHPEIGIISAGRNNRYNHPNKETLETARNNKMTVFNTQINGMMCYEYSGLNGHFKVKIPHEPKTTTTAN